MKKLTLTISAIRFAHASVAKPDGIELDKSLPAEFEKEKFPAADYGHWKQEFHNYRQKFVQLAQQDAPSVAKAARGAKQAVAK